MDNNFVEYGWNDEIVNEGAEFVLLPEGDYDFTVSKVERARYSGSERMPACNMAKVTFTIWGAEDKVEITDNFYLCNKFEWKLSSLFLSVGMKKHGEPLRMNWEALTGKKGKCHVYIDNYKKKDGSDGKSNKIKKLYDYGENVKTVQPAIHNNATVQSSNTGGWTAGSF